MIELNIHEAKTHLSEYLDRIAQGETVILCKRNVPIAEIRPLAPESRSTRPLGLAKGLFKIPPALFLFPLRSSTPMEARRRETAAR